MTKEQALLSILSEECAECAQRAIKAVRFGMEEVQEGHSLNNFDRIVLELADVVAVAEMLGIAQCVTPDMKVAKAMKVATYLRYSADLGMVDLPDNEPTGQLIDGVEY